MKKIILAMITILSSLFLCSCASTTSEYGGLPAESTANNSNDATTSENETVMDEDYLNYTYKDVSIDSMAKTLKDNPLKAESDYVGEYVTFTGYIRYPEPNDDLFIMYETYGNDGEIFCEVNQPLPYSAEIEEEMTVWGKVSEISSGDTPSGGHYSRFSVNALHYEFETPLAPEDIVYTEYTANELLDYYAENGATAENELYHAYVAITAPIQNIDSEGILLGKSNGNNVTLSYGHISCEFTSDAQKAVIAQKNLYDTVTVKGRITYMDESIGSNYYRLRLDSIE